MDLKFLFGHHVVVDDVDDDDGVCCAFFSSDTKSFNKQVFSKNFVWFYVSFDKPVLWKFQGKAMKKVNTKFWIYLRSWKI